MARKLFAFVVVLAAVSLPCAAKMRTLTSPEDRERVVDYARSLEEHPLAKDNLTRGLTLQRLHVQDIWYRMDSAGNPFG